MTVPTNALDAVQALEAREQRICANSQPASCQQRTGFNPVGQLLLMLASRLLESSAVVHLCRDSRPSSRVSFR